MKNLGNCKHPGKIGKSCSKRVFEANPSGNLGISKVFTDIPEILIKFSGVSRRLFEKVHIHAVDQFNSIGRHATLHQFQAFIDVLVGMEDNSNKWLIWKVKIVSVVKKELYVNGFSSKMLAYLLINLFVKFPLNV